METFSQIAALAIFIIMFIVITTGKVPRYIPALIGGALTVIIVFLLILKEPQAVVSVLNFGQIGQLNFWIPGHEAEVSHGVNWQTIIFIGGMMIMVEGLGEVGFFRWLCLFVARLVKYKVVPILVAFMLLSAFLSMFIDSITVMLFLATVTIELARLLKFNPVPLIISEIFASNVGGSATMSGDPPNIIIGTALGYSFFDFVVNTGLIAWIGMVFVLVFFYFAFRKQLKASQDTLNADTSQYPEPGQAITNKTHFLINTGIFILVIILLVTHAQTGISVAAIGVIAALLTIGFAFLKRGHGAIHIIKRLDWQTLLFFFGLFVCVGGLEKTGVLESLANFIGNAAGGNIIVVVTIILWVSAFASAIVDNIPFAATMVPVIVNLSHVGGFDLHPMAWSLALGTDIGGNGTPIGASANVVGTAIAEKNGYPISWGKYCKYALPAMILTIGICWGYLVIRYA
ncbi:MAG TPA: ArsB/NhaD family transporter [Dehalococcoidales bacterium]